MWGSNAYSKYKIIENKENHRFIISSHPSPFSVYNKLGIYDSFMNTNTFGLINKYLKEIDEKNKKNENKYIDWQII